MLTRAQADEVLKARSLAVSTLTGYARYISIPSVPDNADPNERITSVVETPLALHHVFMLNAMQLLVQQLLYYQPHTMRSPVGFDTLRGEKPTHAPVRPDMGYSDLNVHALSGKLQNSKNFGTIAGDLTQIAGNRLSNPPNSNDSKTSQKTSSAKDQSSHSESLTPDAVLSETSIEQSESLLLNSQALTRNLVETETLSEASRNTKSTEVGLSGSTGNTIPKKFHSEQDHNCRVALSAVLKGDLDPMDAMKIVADQSQGLVACRRVMFMLPPGSAKSTYASVVFPTWQMGKLKAFETILTGWGDPVCRRHGKRARQICKSPQFSELFGSQLDPNTRSAEDWALGNGSSYKSSGINSGIAGFRTHGLVWDDLTKNRKEADSEGIRNDVYNAYIDDARSRKTPTAWEVGIGTRWHEDEIMGRILPEGYNGESGFMECRDGNVWYIVCMAAECERTPAEDPLGREKGEMLWEEWFDEAYWREKRVNPRSWGSLYQQRPAPESGIMFKKEKFKHYDNLPENTTVYVSYDPGVSDIGDPTAMHVWKVDEFARIYLVETYYDQVSIDVWIVQLLQWVRKWKPIECISESGVIKRAAEPFILRAMRKAKTFFTQTWITRSANKPAMAAGALAMVNSGQVYLPRNSDGERFLNACLKFPASKDDHEVDSFVNFCLRLENIWEATPIKAPEDIIVDIGGTLKISDLMPPRFAKKAKSKWAFRKGR
jgi:hypothetical protein